MQFKKIRRIAFYLIIILLLVGSANCAKIIAPNDDCPRIQDAIDASSPGDEIEIESGSYNETIIVTKQLTLLGNRSEMPIIRSNGDGISILIRSDGTIIDGIKIKVDGTQNDRTKKRIGIKLMSNNNTIINNEFSLYLGYGIYLDGSSGNNITKNIFNENHCGIYMINSVRNLIMKNNWVNLSYLGIALDNNSNYNNIIENSINGCACGIGKHPESNKHNNIKNNKENNDISECNLKVIQGQGG